MVNSKTFVEENTTFLIGISCLNTPPKIVVSIQIICKANNNIVSYHVEGSL